MRPRTVLCVDGEKNPVSETLCDPSSRPELYQPCSSAPCQYVWVTARWKQVTHHIDPISRIERFLYVWDRVHCKKCYRNKIYEYEYLYDCCIIMYSDCLDAVGSHSACE